LLFLIKEEVDDTLEKIKINKRFGHANMGLKAHMPGLIF
jgi:hypothetical protein